MSGAIILAIAIVSLLFLGLVVLYLVDKGKK